ncbi:hypothetical protein SLEP1_g58989 [Rubroshorea leprosula]|uniref:Uncharacterized protein n=1 Tax=Rubroshorea leprosula TaxID=152421 RepID=A0AAV5MR85_9ROSI|nr:hypothetical protein SLEP1_g58914 [Rubroshorea leprosula]GKV52404.1 hypothetical protein SLEP1_g58989 [Rubroshorea leprosula]
MPSSYRMKMIHSPRRTSTRAVRVDSMSSIPSAGSHAFTPNAPSTKTAYVASTAKTWEQLLL